MKPVMQTRFGADPNAPGNCFSACIASILECALEDLPDEAKIVDAIKQEVGLEVWQSWPDRFKWGKSWLRLWEATQQACVARGFSMVESSGPFGEHPLTLCIISGKSPRGDFDHACVGRGREIIHDPHPAGGGVGTEGREYLFFVAIDPARMRLEKPEEPEEDVCAFCGGLNS